VVLDHVAQDAGFLVIAATALDPQLLASGDLDVVDEAPVPDRLEDGVREAEDQQVLDRLLAQVVIDPEDLPFVASLLHQPVERARGRQVPPERLLDHHPREPAVVGRVDQAGALQLLEQHREGAGRRSEVMEAVPARAAAPIQLLQRGAQASERVRIVERARHVPYAGGEVAPDLRVDRLVPRMPTDSHVADEMCCGISAATPTS
jgi:hypothetical protein